MSVRRLWAVIPIVVIVLSVGLIPATVYGSRPEPGIYLDLRVYSITNIGLTDITQDLRNQRGVVTCVFVDLVEPEQAVSVASKCFRGVPVVFIPHKLLEPGLRKWWESLSKRNVPENVIRTTEVGLIVRVRIYDAVNGKEIFYGLNSIPITLDLFKNPKAIQYTLALRKEISQLVPMERKEITIRPTNVESIAEEQATQTGGALVAKAQSYCAPPVSGPEWRCSCSGDGTYCTCTCYKRIAVVTPETLQQQGALPPNYFRVGSDGKLYVATPILIIDNTQNKGFIHAWISMNRSNTKLEAKLSYKLNPDKVLPDALQGKVPSINIQLGGATFGGQGYYGYASFYVCPGTAQWAYIWARPIFEWYSVYQYYKWTHGGEVKFEYIRDDITAYISDVLTFGSVIWVEGVNGMPADTLMNVFFKGVNTSDVYVPMGVRMGVGLSAIFKSCDTCGSGFEVGVPAGAIAAMGICAVVSATLGGLPLAACPAITAIASGFQVSLGYESASIYIDGIIENSGAVNFGLGCPAQDTRVYMYVATSRFRYAQSPPWWCPWCSPCYYRVPAGIYVRIVPTS